MTPEELIDSILAPHHSEMTGEMIQRIVWRELKIPPHAFLAVSGAETSMGDPELGGKLVQSHNYGCVRSGSPNSPWGSLASGTVEVGGKLWWEWPDVETGVRALARVLRYGPLSHPEYYYNCIKRKDWYAPFALRYYGSGVDGYSAYVDRLKKIDQKLITIARQNGVIW